MAIQPDCTKHFKLIIKRKWFVRWQHLAQNCHKTWIEAYDNNYTQIKHKCRNFKDVEPWNNFSLVKLQACVCILLVLSFLQTNTDTFANSVDSEETVILFWLLMDGCPYLHKWTCPNSNVEESISETWSWKVKLLVCWNFKYFQTQWFFFSQKKKKRKQRKK